MSSALNSAGHNKGFCLTDVITCNTKTDYIKWWSHGAIQNYETPPPKKGRKEFHGSLGIDFCQQCLHFSTLTKWPATHKGPASAWRDHTKTCAQHISGRWNPPHCSGLQDNVRRMAVRVRDNRRRWDCRGVPGAARREDRWSRERREHWEPGRNSNLS